MRYENILNDIEADYGIEFDANWWPEALCGDLDCRHSECQCWDDFRAMAEAEAQRLAAEKDADPVNTMLGKVEAYVFVAMLASFSLGALTWELVKRG